MAILKMQTADTTPKGKRRLVASTGGYGVSNPNSQHRRYSRGETIFHSLSKSAQVGNASVTHTQPMFFSPLHTPQNWQIASKRREIYQWARFYYENEPKVAAGVDFYAHFPLNGFRLECRDKRVLQFYENVVDDLELNDWCNYISHDYFLIGDAYPFLEISCPVCGGSGSTPENEPCNHPDGTFSSIRVLNPDYVEVQDNVLAGEPLIALLPDEELQVIIQRKQPKQIYDALPQFLIDLVASQQPIPLSNRSVSHLKHNASGYSTYGTSLLRRLFTVLAYKTKIMTANWIIAERLILPVRVVKIGDKERPATEEDIQDVVNQMGAVANDPNLTIVTHHAFEYEWFGACYDASTEILTPSGWRKFSDINKNDLVATYNQNTGEMQYQQPEEYYTYDYNSSEFGKMHKFKSKSVDINVTPNHRMLIERNGNLKEVYSQDVKHNDKFLSQVKWRGRIPENLPYKNSPLAHLSLDEYLEFVGYYISEGGSKEDRRANLNPDKWIQACSISQSRTSGSFDAIEFSVKSVYPNYSTYEDDRNSGCCLMTINNVDIARYLAMEFGSHSWNKNVPQWIRNLPQDKIRILYDAMMAGDGSVRYDSVKPRYKYTTTSKQLSDDFSDMCLKIGFWPYTYKEISKNPNHKDIYRVFYSEHREETKFNIRNQHIIREEYIGKVYCVKVPNSWVMVRRNGKISICGNSGKIHNISAELEEIGKEILDGLMLNQALLNGEMSGYNSAQVGVEIMIRRLENWRNKLKNWIEKKVFLPIAMMQGFIDEDKSQRSNREVYLHPIIKWNDLELRDKTNKVQLLIQMFDKQMVSMQTIHDEMGLDYDSEIEKMREEQVITQQGGQIMGPQAGGMGGAPGGDMGMGGAPPMDMGGGAPGGDMGMGAPGGDMGGGAPGGMGGDMGGGMGAAAGGASPPKVMKKGKASKAKADEEEPPPLQPLKLTKLEGRMYKALASLDVPFKLFGQYKVNCPGQPQPFVLDFAYPEVGVGVETDGDIWHQRADLKAQDQERDQKLANVGWRILRFNEEAVENQMPVLTDIIRKNVIEAYQDRKRAGKKANAEEGMKKFAEAIDRTRHPETASGLNLKVVDIPGIDPRVAYMIHIGT